MTLITSISGIRGTIGGKPGDNLTPVDIVRFTAAFVDMMTHPQKPKNGERIKIVVGRDARMSGDMVSRLVIGTLLASGVDVVDLGLSTTPTVEVAVPREKADGGIILTASHNPVQWNALKLLNADGEFIDEEQGLRLLELVKAGDFDFAEVRELGTCTTNDSYLDKHVAMVVDHPLVDVEAIRNADFKVAVDAVNSTGGIFVPALLDALGVRRVERLYCDPTGDFPHNPEPLPEHLAELSKVVKGERCDLGIVVDPDVDRLAFVCENGEVFGEEYTLVAVADYVLGRSGGGNTVSNLSSTRALRDVTEKHGGQYSASAVGEVNVVKKMKETNSLIGGEGNGGIIDPTLHYGRDALVGIGLFLSHLARTGKTMTELRASYPDYFMSKNKIELTPGIDVDSLLDEMAERYAGESVNRVDGVKIDFADRWVHLRKSNTEPIIRVYSEAPTREEAIQLAERIMEEIKSAVS